MPVPVPDSRCLFQCLVPAVLESEGRKVRINKANGAYFQKVLTVSYDMKHRFKPRIRDLSLGRAAWGGA